MAKTNKFTLEEKTAIATGVIYLSMVVVTFGQIVRTFRQDLKSYAEDRLDRKLNEEL